jgi:hypothetical protein
MTKSKEDTRDSELAEQFPVLTGKNVEKISNKPKNSK